MIHPCESLLRGMCVGAVCLSTIIPLCLALVSFLHDVTSASTHLTPYGLWRAQARLCITGAKQIGDTALQAYFQCVIARAMESQGRLEEAVEVRRVHLSFVREELGQGRAKHQGGSIQDYCECYALSLLGSSCEKLGRSLASRRRATARHDFVSSPDDQGNGLDLVGPRLKEGGGRAWNEGSEVVVMGIDQAWNGSCLVEQSSDGHLGMVPSYFLKITPGGVEALDDAIACHAKHEAIAGRQGQAGDLLRACAISLRGYALQTKVRAEIGCEKGAGSDILFRTPSGSEELTTTMMAMNCHGEVFQLARDMYERELQELSREDMHLSQDQVSIESIISNYLSVISPFMMRKSFILKLKFWWTRIETRNNS
jgi:hypothetical protein